LKTPPAENSTGMVIRLSLWETVCMSEKRTKADKSQRRADQLEKKARHPAAKKKKTSREDFGQAAARIVREATEDK
jgi:hypothetical protein